MAIRRHRAGGAATLVGLAISLAWLASACQWLWPNDARYDPKRCGEPCAPGSVCQEGACVAPRDAAPGEEPLPPPPAGAWATLVQGYSTGHGVAVDGAGNGYVIGTFSGIALLDELDPLTASESLFVAKIDRAGRFLWAVHPGGGETTGHDIAVDADGEQVMISGTFRGTVRFGAHELSNKGAESPFVARLDGDGRFAWATAAGSGSPPGVALDPTGNGYAVGGFSAESTFGATSLQPAASASRDLYLAKLDPQGAFLWARQGGASDWMSGEAVAVDAAGNAHVAGVLQGKAQLDGALLETPQSALFVAKLDAEGTFDWAVAATGSSGASSIAVADAGDVLLSGYGSRRVTLGAHSVDVRGQSGLLVARLDGAGRPLWVRAVGGTGIDVVGGVAVEVTPAGCHVAGSIVAEVGAGLTFGDLGVNTKSQQELFVALVSFGGVFRRVTTVANAIPADIALDGEGNTLLVGTLKGGQRFGQTVLVPTEESHAVVARLNAEGQH